MNNFNSIRHRVKVTLNAERTEDEVLAELTYLKNRVDLTHHLVAQLNKKLEGFVKDYGKGTEEKKLKKMPEEVVSVVMRQHGSHLQREFPERSILGDVVTKCGETQHEMAQFQTNYESRLEQNVLSPLQNMLEEEFEMIQKNMLELKNLAMKVDMAKSRYKDSYDKLQKFSKSGLSDAEKERSLKDKLRKDEDDVEIATHNLEQFKDSVATNLLNFVNKESQTSEKLVDLLVIQRDYHYSCYRQVDELLPILRDGMKNYAHKVVYGTSLEEHLRVTKREIAVVLEECASVMTEIGLEEEGLLRIPGSNSKIKRIIAALNYPGEVDWDYFATDIHSIGGALKQYFRDLPECLLTDRFYDAWLDVAQKLQGQTSEGSELDLSLITDLLYQLPKCNFVNLRYLIKFLAEMAKCSEASKMTPTNLAIVMGGNVLWRHGQDAFVLRTTPLKNLLVEVMIGHCEELFPDFQFAPKRLLKQEVVLDHSYQVGPSLLAASSSFYSSASNNSLNSLGASNDRETSPAIAHNQISQSPDGSASAFVPGHRRNESGDANHHPPKPTDGLLQKLTTPTPRKSFKQRPAPSPAPPVEQRSSTLPRPRSETPPDMLRPVPAPPVNRPPSGPPPGPPHPQPAGHPPVVMRPTPAPRDFSRPPSGPPSFSPPDLLPAKPTVRVSPPAQEVAGAAAAPVADASAITFELVNGAEFIAEPDAPPIHPPPSKAGSASKSEKPPVSRNKPSLTEEKPVIPPPPDNHHAGGEAARPPRPQSKPPLPASAAAPNNNNNGSGRPPPRPVGGPPPPPHPPPSNRTSEPDDVFTHL